MAADKNNHWSNFIFFRRVRKISKSDYHLRHVRRSAWKNSASTGQIFYESLNLRIFRKCAEKIQVSLKSDKNNWYFT
jgi:hypothetical protein